MNISLGFILRRALPLSSALALAGLLAAACDLPDKNLGGGDDDPSGTTTGDVCEPGDEMAADCNTCTCVDGQWACTEIACAGSSDGADSGYACDPAEDPSDDCSSCSCVDGEWLCTAIACADTEPDACEPGTNPTNGCNTCSCETGEWICTDEACPEEPAVALCDGTEPNDPLFVTNASIMGDTLLVDVESSGGCVAHGYGSCWDGNFDESNPVQVSLQINHEDNDDPCEAIVMDTLSFDLTPVRDAWIDAYQSPSGTIILNVADWGSLDYTF